MRYADLHCAIFRSLRSSSPCFTVSKISGRVLNGYTQTNIDNSR